MENTRSTDFENIACSQEEKKPLTVCGIEFVYLGILAIMLGFVGWLAENTVRAISVGIIDCRFHLLPFIGEYGLIVFAVHLVFGTPDDFAFFGHHVFKKKTLTNKVLSNVLAFVIMCAVVFLAELGLGNLWDKVFGLQLWDYSSLPFSVTRYAGLIPSLGYGFGCWLLFRLAYAPALKLVRKMDYKVAKTVCCTLGILIVADFIFMLVQFIIFKQAPMWWSTNLR